MAKPGSGRAASRPPQRLAAALTASRRGPSPAPPQTGMGRHAAGDAGKDRDAVLRGAEPADGAASQGGSSVQFGCLTASAWVCARRFGAGQRCRNLGCGPPPAARATDAAVVQLGRDAAQADDAAGPDPLDHGRDGLGWQQGQIGLVLTTGSICSIASQLPGGAIVDGARSKRAVVAVALLLVAAGAVMLFLSHALWFVLLAQVLHGCTAGLITPARAAIGLGLVGHRGLSERLGRNHRYDSFGNAGTAGIMGLLGHYLAKRVSFLFAAGLCVPALWALSRIRGDEIDYNRARSAKSGQPDDHPARYRDLLKNKQLLIFAGALILFQIANASAIPLVSERLGQRHEGESELVVAGLVIVPQVITAALASWTADRADAWGRKPLLLAAFGALALRVLLFTVAPGRRCQVV